MSNRDASDIWIGCLITITASTFLALHLNVRPASSVVTTRHFLRRWWHSRTTRQFRRQLFWTALVAIAPELLVGLSYGDWHAARVGHHMFKCYGKGHVKEWTKMHASFANMGGLKFRMKMNPSNSAQHVTEDIIIQEIHENSGTVNTTLRKISRFFSGILSIFTSNTRVQAALAWAMRILGRICDFVSRWHGIRILLRPANQPRSTSGQNPNDGAFEFAEGSLQSANPQSRNSTTNPTPIRSSRGEVGAVDSSTTSSGPQNQPAPRPSSSSRTTGISAPVLEETTLYLNATQIVVAQHLGVLDEGPLLRDAGIEDKSKANPFAKSIAMISLFWFVLGILIQFARNEKLTQLELSTFAYAVCAMIAYSFYWLKPQAVETPIEHSVIVSASVRPVTHVEIENTLRRFGGTSFLSRNFIPPFGMDNKLADPSEPTPDDTSLTVFANIWGVFFYDDDAAGTAVGVVFGAIYCLAWNDTFPFLWELYAWRVSSIVITASFVPYSIVNNICTNLFGGSTSGTTQKSHAVHNLMLFALVGLYGACRLFMLFEMIHALLVLNVQNKA